MNQQANLELVREIYDAVGRGDVTAILDRVTDDVDWAAEALRAPFCLGTPDQLGDLMRPSFGDVRVIRREGQARAVVQRNWRDGGRVKEATYVSAQISYWF